MPFRIEGRVTLNKGDVVSRAREISRTLRQSLRTTSDIVFRIQPALEAARRQTQRARPFEVSGNLRIRNVAQIRRELERVSFSVSAAVKVRREGVQRQLDAVRGRISVRAVVDPASVREMEAVFRRAPVKVPVRFVPDVAGLQAAMARRVVTVKARAVLDVSALPKSVGTVKAPVVPVFSGPAPVISVHGLFDHVQLQTALTAAGPLQATVSVQTSVAGGGAGDVVTQLREVTTNINKQLAKAIIPETQLDRLKGMTDVVSGSIPEMEKMGVQMKRMASEVVAGGVSADVARGAFDKFKGELGRVRQISEQATKQADIMAQVLRNKQATALDLVATRGAEVAEILGKTEGAETARSKILKKQIAILKERSSLTGQQIRELDGLRLANRIGQQALADFGDEMRQTNRVIKEFVTQKPISPSLINPASARNVEALRSLVEPTSARLRDLAEAARQMSLEIASGAKPVGVAGDLLKALREQTNRLANIMREASVNAQNYAARLKHDVAKGSAVALDAQEQLRTGTIRLSDSEKMRLQRIVDTHGATVRAAESAKKLSAEMLVMQDRFGGQVVAAARTGDELRSLSRGYRFMGATGVRELSDLITRQLAWVGSFVAVFGALAAFRKALTASFDLTTAQARAFRTVRDETLSLAKAQALVGDELDQTTRRFGVSTAEAGEAFFQLGTAGLQARESVAAIIPIMNAVIASDIEVEQAVKTTVAAYNVFGDQLKSVGGAAAQFTRILDVLTKAAAESVAEVPDLAQGLKFVTGSARLAGATLEETVAALATLQQQGINAGIAGRSLNQVFISLAQNSAEVGRVFGVTIDPSKPLEFVKVIRQIATQMNVLGDSVQVQAEIFRIFNARGGRAFIALTKNVDDFNQTLEGLRLEADGATKKMADLILAAPAKQFQILGQSVLALGREAFAPLGAVIVGIVKTLNVLALVVEGLNDAFGGLPAKIFGVAASLLTLSVAATAIFSLFGEGGALSAVPRFVVGIGRDVAGVAGRLADAGRLLVGTLRGTAVALTTAETASLAAAGGMGRLEKAIVAVGLASRRTFAFLAALSLPVKIAVAAIAALTAGVTAFVLITRRSIESLKEKADELAKEREETEKNIATKQRELDIINKIVAARARESGSVDEAASLSAELAQINSSLVRGLGDQQRAIPDKALKAYADVLERSISLMREQEQLQVGKEFEAQAEGLKIARQRVAELQADLDATKDAIVEMQTSFQSDALTIDPEIASRFASLEQQQVGLTLRLVEASKGSAEFTAGLIRIARLGGPIAQRAIEILGEDFRDLQEDIEKAGPSLVRATEGQFRRFAATLSREFEVAIPTEKIPEILRGAFSRIKPSSLAEPVVQAVEKIQDRSIREAVEAAIAQFEFLRRKGESAGDALGEVFASVARRSEAALPVVRELFEKAVFDEGQVAVLAAIEEGLKKQEDPFRSNVQLAREQVDLAKEELAIRDQSGELLKKANDELFKTGKIQSEELRPVAEAFSTLLKANVNLHKVEKQDEREIVDAERERRQVIAAIRAQHQGDLAVQVEELRAARENLAVLRRRAKAGQEGAVVAARRAEVDLLREETELANELVAAQGRIVAALGTTADVVGMAQAAFQRLGERAEEEFKKVVEAVISADPSLFGRQVSRAFGLAVTTFEDASAAVDFFTEGVRAGIVNVAALPPHLRQFAQGVAEAEQASRRLAAVQERLAFDRLALSLVRFDMALKVKDFQQAEQALSDMGQALGGIQDAEKAVAVVGALEDAMNRLRQAQIDQQRQALERLEESGELKKLKEGRAAVDELSSSIRSLLQIADIKVSIRVDQVPTGVVRDIHGTTVNQPVIKRQEGGIVPGAGTGDTVPAMLEPGEFIVPREVVRARGVSHFERMRAGRFQEGGLVGRPDLFIMKEDMLRGFSEAAPRVIRENLPDVRIVKGGEVLSEEILEKFNIVDREDKVFIHVMEGLFEKDKLIEFTGSSLAANIDILAAKANKGILGTTEALEMLTSPEGILATIKGFGEAGKALLDLAPVVAPEISALVRDQSLENAPLLRSWVERGEKGIDDFLAKPPELKIQELSALTGSLIGFIADPTGIGGRSKRAASLIRDLVNVLESEKGRLALEVSERAARGAAAAGRGTFADFFGTTAHLGGNVAAASRLAAIKANRVMLDHLENVVEELRLPGFGEFVRTADGVAFRETVKGPTFLEFARDELARIARNESTVKNTEDLANLFKDRLRQGLYESAERGQFGLRGMFPDEKALVDSTFQGIVNGPTIERILALSPEVGSLGNPDRVFNFLEEKFRFELGRVKGKAFEPLTDVGIGLDTIRKGDEFLAIHRQAGGIVPGAGRGDKVPALLEPGEFVIPVDVVRRLGLDFFEKLRALRMAGGGLVPVLAHMQEGGVAGVAGHPEETVPTGVSTDVSEFKNAAEEIEKALARIRKAADRNLDFSIATANAVVAIRQIGEVSGLTEGGVDKLEEQVRGLSGVLALAGRQKDLPDILVRLGRLVEENAEDFADGKADIATFSAEIERFRKAATQPLSLDIREFVARTEIVKTAFGLMRSDLGKPVQVQFADTIVGLAGVTQSLGASGINVFRFQAQLSSLGSELAKTPEGLRELAAVNAVLEESFVATRGQLERGTGGFEAFRLRALSAASAAGVSGESIGRLQIALSDMGAQIGASATESDRLRMALANLSAAATGVKVGPGIANLAGIARGAVIEVVNLQSTIGKGFQLDPVALQTALVDQLEAAGVKGDELAARVNVTAQALVRAGGDRLKVEEAIGLAFTGQGDAAAKVQAVLGTSKIDEEKLLKAAEERRKAAIDEIAARRLASPVVQEQLAAGAEFLDVQKEQRRIATELVDKEIRRVEEVNRVSEAVNRVNQGLAESGDLSEIFGASIKNAFSNLAKQRVPGLQDLLKQAPTPPGGGGGAASLGAVGGAASGASGALQSLTGDLGGVQSAMGGASAGAADLGSALGGLGGASSGAGLTVAALGSGLADLAASFGDSIGASDVFNIAMGAIMGGPIGALIALIAEVVKVIKSFFELRVQQQQLIETAKKEIETETKRRDAYKQTIESLSKATGVTARFAQTSIEAEQDVRRFTVTALADMKDLGATELSVQFDLATPEAQLAQIDAMAAQTAESIPSWFEDVSDRIDFSGITTKVEHVGESGSAIFDKIVPPDVFAELPEEAQKRVGEMKTEFAKTVAGIEKSFDQQVNEVIKEANKQFAEMNEKLREAKASAADFAELAGVTIDVGAEGFDPEQLFQTDVLASITADIDRRFKEVFEGIPVAAGAAATDANQAFDVFAATGAETFDRFLEVAGVSFDQLTPEAQKELVKTKQAFAKSFDSINKNFDKQQEELNETFAKGQAEAREDFQKNLDRLVIDNAEAVKEINQGHIEALADIQKRFERATADLATSLSRDELSFTDFLLGVRDAQVEADRARADEGAEVAKSLADNEEERAERELELREELADKLTDLEENLEERRAELEEERREALEEAVQQQLEAFMALSQSQLENAEATNAAITELQTRTNENLVELNEQRQEALDEAIAQQFAGLLGIQMEAEQTITDINAQLQEKVNQTAEAIKQSFETTFDTLLGSLLGPILQALAPLFDVIQQIMEVLKPIFEILGAILSLALALDPVLNTFRLLLPLLQPIVDAMNKLSEAVSGFVQEIRDFITGLTTKILEAIVSFADSVWEKIKGFFGFASGGVVPGPRVHRDVVPAMLTPGEFVIRESSVNEETLPTLMSINEGLRGFAAGGAVQYAPNTVQHFGIVDKFKKSVVDPVSGVASTVVGSVGDFFKDPVGALKSAGVDIGAATENAIKTATGPMKDVFSQMVGGAIDIGSKFGSATAGKFMDLVGASGDFFATAGGSAKKVGLKMIEMSAATVDHAVNFFSNLLDFVKAPIKAAAAIATFPAVKFFDFATEGLKGAAEQSSAGDVSLPALARGGRVPAMLTPGEFVVPRAAASQHASALRFINETGHLPSQLEPAHTSGFFFGGDVHGHDGAVTPAYAPRRMQAGGFVAPGESVQNIEVNVTVNMQGSNFTGENVADQIEGELIRRFRNREGGLQRGLRNTFRSQ